MTSACPPPRIAGALALLSAALALASPAAAPAASSSTPKPAPSTSSAPQHKTSTKKHRRPKPPPPPEVAFPPALAAAPSLQVTMPPVGVSFEYPTLALAMGSGSCPPPALTGELEKLGSPPIELGGVSQDAMFPEGAANPPPRGNWEGATVYTLPATFWGRLRCLLETTREPLTVGLNMRTGLSESEQLTIAAARQAATAGLEFSLGNEPDLYDLPNYAALDQPLPGAEADAVGLYLRLAAEMAAPLEGTPTTGPELARPLDWQRELPHLLATERPHIVGVHMYPLSACSNPHAVTTAGLLSESAAAAPQRLAWVVADANAAGLPAILSEANSASCGGKSGVSDSPAAAVWAVRFVLSALKTGFREVRFHFSGDPYDPFLVREGLLVARPLESALVALNQWLPSGSLLRTLPGVRGIVASIAATPAGTALLALDNESTEMRPVVLRDTGPLTIQTLTATSAGIATQSLTPVNGRLALSLAANTVTTVTGALTPTVPPAVAAGSGGR
jgi:hypothetical protein